MKTLIQKIKENLTPDLLTPYWRNKAVGTVDGHCYVATECFYYVYGRDHGWKPMVYRSDDGDTHWWLEKGGEVLDITAEQFKEEYNYSSGHGQSFMSHPSKRCLTLVGRIKNVSISDS